MKSIKLDFFASGQVFTSPVTSVDALIAVLVIVAFLVRNILAARDLYFFNVFWLCDAAAGLVGPAILLHNRTLSAVSFMCLLPGNIVWVVNNMVSNIRVSLTGFAMHFGGLAAAVYAVHRNGYTSHAWIAALGLQIALYTISRLLLPASHNINGVWSIPRGWDFLGGGPARFFTVYALVSLFFALIGQILVYWIASA